MSTFTANAFAQELDPGSLDAEMELKDPRWAQFYNVRLGAGYNDNVLRSRFVDQTSPLTFAEFDAIVVLLPKDGLDFNVFVTGQDIRYLGPGSSDNDQSFITVASVTQEIGKDWVVGLQSQYVYLNQVFDISASLLDLGNIKSQLHQGGATPSIRRNLPNKSWLELDFEIRRSEFLAPAGDEWEVGPSLSYGREYGRRSEWKLSYERLRRTADDSNSFDVTGGLIPGTTLTRNQHELEFRIRHYWDKARRWRTSTKLEARFNKNSGSTFFDYNRYQISQEIQYRDTKWELRSKASFNFYSYVSRTVSATNSEKRKRNRLNVESRIQRKISNRWMLFAQHELEFANSNRVSDDYTANVVIGGIEWEY
jgi:hypothetical protein